MKGFKEATHKQIVINESTMTDLFIVDNTIYVIGNISINDKVLQKEINSIVDDMMQGERNLVNVVSSESVSTYYVTKPGSKAEELLGLSV